MHRSALQKWQSNSCGSPPVAARIHQWTKATTQQISVLISRSKLAISYAAKVILAAEIPRWRIAGKLLLLRVCRFSYSLWVQLQRLLAKLYCPHSTPS